jgi:hypothetical protein
MFGMFSAFAFFRMVVRVAAGGEKKEAECREEHGQKSIFEKLHSCIFFEMWWCSLQIYLAG